MDHLYSPEWRNLPEKHRQIIEKHQSSSKVQLAGIARNLNIQVKSSVLPTDVSGKIQKDENGYVIRVNLEHPKARQRFTVAHEIAHFLLHQDAIGDGIVDDPLYRSGLPDSKEWEANRLAADIILPPPTLNRLREEAKNCNEDVISYIANCASVSKDVVKIRLGVPL